jgi:hypothetical protein
LFRNERRICKPIFIAVRIPTRPDAKRRSNHSRSPDISGFGRYDIRLQFTEANQEWILW